MGTLDDVAPALSTRRLQLSAGSRALRRSERGSAGPATTGKRAFSARRRARPELWRPLSRRDADVSVRCHPDPWPRERDGLATAPGAATLSHADVDRRKNAGNFTVWMIAAVPALSIFPTWSSMGGHLAAPESLNLVLGHLLYGLLVGAIALFAAAISDSAATAAIVTLAFTTGSWVLDFALAGQMGPFDWLARLSLTQALRSFEQGLLSVGCSRDHHCDCWICRARCCVAAPRHAAEGSDHSDRCLRGSGRADVGGLGAGQGFI